MKLCLAQLKYVLIYITLRLLVAGLSPQRHGHDRKLLHVQFVVDKVTAGEVCLRELQILNVSIIPRMLHTHILFTYDRHYDTINISNWRVVK